MTATNSALPAYTPSSGGEVPPPGGMRGEASDNADFERPEFRRDVRVDDARTITVEESSGTAFAEASGAVQGTAAEHTAVNPPLRQEPNWPSPGMFAAAFAGGVLLAMLSSSTRRHPDRDGASETHGAA
jgi:hypothetical protein